MKVSVPYETWNLQPNMMRYHSGLPLLYEGREINIPWNGIMGQDRSIHGTNQAAGEGILPGERQLLDAIKRAGYARKDPERVCIHCGASFKTRENKEKHSTRCIRNAQTQKVSRATKEYICVRCSKMYRSKKALIDHATTCQGTMCCTSPLGSIIQEV